MNTCSQFVGSTGQCVKMFIKKKTKKNWAGILNTRLYIRFSHGDFIFLKPNSHTSDNSRAGVG